MTTLPIQRLYPDAVVPTFGSDGAIGLDLYSLRQITVGHGEVVPVGTGVAVAIPHGYYGRIAPRSGLAAKKGIDVLAGVIDSDYRGELMVLLTSHCQGHRAVIEKGDRIAQLILEKADRLPPELVLHLPVTDRGSGGFGSTGS